VVSTSPRPLYPREIPSTHGPRAGLDVCEKCRPHREFFFLLFCLVVSSTSLFWYWTFNGRLYRIVLHAVDFFQQEKSDGFGRERTRDLGYQRPACKHLDHRSRWIRSPDRPARSQSLYRLSYRAHFLYL
jgi:hypothetical protein